MKSLRQNQTQDLARVKSVASQKRLLQTACWRKAGAVALYMAARGEMQTDLLFEDAIHRKKKIYFPRVIKESDGLMDFVPVEGPGDFAPGSFGILEPIWSLESVPEKDFSPDLVVVPGVAFDRKGCRIGFGGGYYDRFFGRFPDLTLAGFCFSFQLVDGVPGDPWDVRMKYICTERELLRFGL